MKQYSVLFSGMSIEYTGYFKTPGDVRTYLKKKYKDNGAGLTFRAVYPKVEEKIYHV
jgi:hypothetical protein